MDKSLNKIVSIIVPCHNCQDYISYTINSILNQTYKNIEVICIDDGSTDSTPYIINEYCIKDSRIKIFSTNKPSGGPSKPRNIGIEKASGEYIAFLDADDVWMANKLERQISFMEQTGSQISYSYYEKIDQNGVRKNRIIRTASKANYNDLLKSNSIPCLTSIVTKKAIGNTRFKSIPQEDFCFWLDILKKGYSAHNICSVTALYRIVRGSRSENKLAMFRGYWNVIYNHQSIPFFKCCYYMMTYTILGLIKYLK